MFYYHDNHDGTIGHSELHEHTHEHAHTHSHDGTTHEHTHSHFHDHNESHSHTHPHSDVELHLENKDMQTLYALLDHWVEHNVSHTKGFAEWAEKAIAQGKTETADAIKEAITLMDASNEKLRLAKEKMK